ncbi:hypothetical protein GCM10023183_37510 [Nibribacter koreensis]|uniref:Uncharacterized protein n=1 Tax=Nibribacter koreensis TaxID=1084519 RepID=A0ABP8G3U5_9BACT
MFRMPSSSIKAIREDKELGVGIITSDFPASSQLLIVREVAEEILPSG